MLSYQLGNSSPESPDASPPPTCLQATGPPSDPASKGLTPSTALGLLESISVLKSVPILIGWWPCGNQLLNMLNITPSCGHKKGQSQVGVVLLVQEMA